MPTHAEKKELPYSCDQMFALVADVDKYPEFLPWCLSSRITRSEGDVFYADLVIGYKMVREKFTSKVVLDKENNTIRVEYLKGPLKHLSNKWIFIPRENGGCMIDFYVDFEFRNAFFQSLMGVFFNEIVIRMVAAFEDRAKRLYA